MTDTTADTWREPIEPQQGSLPNSAFKDCCGSRINLQCKCGLSLIDEARSLLRETWGGSGTTPEEKRCGDLGVALRTAVAMHTVRDRQDVAIALSDGLFALAATLQAGRFATEHLKRKLKKGRFQ